MGMERMDDTCILRMFWVLPLALRVDGMCSLQRRRRCFRVLPGISAAAARTLTSARSCSPRFSAQHRCFSLYHLLPLNKQTTAGRRTLDIALLTSHSLCPASTPIVSSVFYLIYYISPEPLKAVTPRAAIMGGLRMTT
jgi:hypothetical protein